MADIPVHSIVSVSAKIRLFGSQTGSLGAASESSLKVAANSPVMLKSPDHILQSSVGALKNSESKKKGKKGECLMHWSGVDRDVDADEVDDNIGASRSSMTTWT